jgi:hypothetical protein
LAFQRIENDESAASAANSSGRTALKPMAFLFGNGQGAAANALSRPGKARDTQASSAGLEPQAAS